MSETHSVALAATILLAVGLWLALPRGTARGRSAGLVLSLAALGLFASQLAPFGGWIAQSLFYLLAGVAVISAICAVSFRSPVYCAIWFALTLLSIGALFLFQGAQFLGVATVVVYAGAILVTFLFVLMLAQPEGHSTYDRITWEPALAAGTGAVLVGVLSVALGGVFGDPGAAVVLADADEASEAANEEAESPSTAPGLTDSITAEARDGEILNDEHVLQLGTQLFSRHLIAVEVAGAMLLAALVGAVAIAAREKPLGAEGGPQHG